MKIFGKSALLVAFFLCCTLLNPSTGVIQCPQLPWLRNGHLACTTPSLAVNTVCKAVCDRGYNLHGSTTRKCQANGSWSGSPAKCQVVTCAPHPVVPLARVNRDDCITKRVLFYRTCTFICPRGYHFKNDGYHVKSNYCQIDGTWQHKNLGSCHDYMEPYVTCPHDVMVETSLGKPTAEVSWSAIKVSDNSVSVDPSAHVTVKSSHTSPHKFTIGSHRVKITATDGSGNSRQCSFSVVVRDVEPPKFQKCPADITVECVDQECRVTWDRPIASDNSGFHPMIDCSRNSGDKFFRGVHEVQCQARDGSSNTAKCKFTVTVKGKSCPHRPAPKNGALVCLEAGRDRLCLVHCSSRYDVPAFAPPTAYMCSRGKWTTFLNPALTSQWPDCSVAYLPGAARKLGGPGTAHYYYYSGSASDAAVQAKMKQNFVAALSSPTLPLCTMQGIFKCDVKNIKIYIGKTKV